MKLGAVVVNWNSRDHLRRLVESLQPLPLDRIVIVDNASEDGSQRGLAPDSRMKLIELDRNLGFAGAANLGIRHAEADFLFLLNPDVEMRGTIVDPLMDEIHRRPEVAVACPALVDATTGRLQSTFQCRPLPTLVSVICDALFLDELLAGVRGRRRAPEAAVVEVEQPAAACWLLRRRAWQDIGGFDERFFPAWFEDVDFCRRLGAAGWRMVVLSGQRVSHFGGYSVQRLGRRRFTEIYYANLLRYWRKHHRLSYPLVWGPVKLGIRLRRLVAQ